jgi:1,4-dihydroxy-6-naphthoate synthase
MLKKIVVAHSPDPDDAFMFYALARQKIDTGEFEFKHVFGDIEALNRQAMKGKYEVSAISIHAYPYVANNYALLTCGASMGYKYGPIVVSKRPLDSIKGKTIAIPGTLTTAYLTLKLLEDDFVPKVMPFDEILDAVEKEKCEAGLIIHEGQLTYKDKNLYKVIDLGEWWYDETSLPLPLGGNVIKKDLGEEAMKRISDYIKESISYALEHENAALDYAIKFGRDLKKEETRRFVRMYVNDFTLDYGKTGREAIRVLLYKAREKGILEKKVELEFVM